MKELQYKDFSLRTHLKGQKGGQPSCCQFELTFACALHCRHCWTDCYNQRAFIKKELGTAGVKKIIAKIRQMGVFWLCFTGGDPLFRKDFPEIYAYAKQKGFLVTVFTSGYSFGPEILKIFRRFPPFVVEITLNAVYEKLYERISQVKGSFEKVMASIKTILKADIFLKIKTQVTRDNQSHIPEIRKFLGQCGLAFRPDYHLFARLNKDTAPCALRVSPEKVLSLFKEKADKSVNCRMNISRQVKKNKLFHCTLDNGEEFHIDPFGRMFLCHGIRFLGADVLRQPLEPTFKKLLLAVRRSKFKTDSQCAACRMREDCLNCPGRAYLENSDMEAPTPYYCELTRRIRGQ